jgi:hypothetical protein
MDVMFQLIVCRIELVDFREEPTLRSPYLLLLANRLLRIEGHVVEGNTNDVSNLISNATFVPRTESSQTPRVCWCLRQIHEQVIERSTPTPVVFFLELFERIG